MKEKYTYLQQNRLKVTLGLKQWNLWKLRFKCSIPIVQLFYIKHYYSPVKVKKPVFGMIKMLHISAI